GADGDGMKGADGDGMILEVNNLEVKSKGEWKTWVMEAFASELEEGIDGYELAEQAVRVLGQTEAAKRWNIPNPEDVAHKLLNESYLKRNVEQENRRLYEAMKRDEIRKAKDE